MSYVRIQVFAKPGSVPDFEETGVTWEIERNTLILEKETGELTLFPLYQVARVSIRKMGAKE